MPRLLAVGHVTWDKVRGGEILGGSASYAALAAGKLGWEAAVLTSAGPDFDPARDIPGVSVFLRGSPATTRFQNVYESDGTRRQVLTSRSEDIDLSALPDEWRNPDALLLGPVAGELPGGLAPSFEAGVVGAIAQGWLRGFDRDGRVSPREWADPQGDLAGVHVLFLSEQDMEGAADWAHGCLAHVPIVAVTRGWQGVSLLTRERVQEFPTLPRREVDPTGAGDVFAAAFLVRYQETSVVDEAAAFAACAASCAVEGLGVSSLGDRAEVVKRMDLRQRLIEEGEWEE